MAVQYKVTAAAAVVRVGDAERYLYRGASVPSGVSGEDIKRLTKLGLISKVAPVTTKAEEPAEGSDAKSEK